MIWAADKILHYNIGYKCGKYAFIIGFIVSIILGAGKELKDLLGKGTPELNDFKATVIGGWDGMLRKENRFITK